MGVGVDLMNRTNARTVCNALYTIVRMAERHPPVLAADLANAWNTVATLRLERKRVVAVNSAPTALSVVFAIGRA